MFVILFIYFMLLDFYLSKSYHSVYQFYMGLVFVLDLGVQMDDVSSETRFSSIGILRDCEINLLGIEIKK